MTSTETFHERMLGAFGRAEQQVLQAPELTLGVAGLQVRLKFAGYSLLAPLTRALRHLAQPPTPQPDVTLALWSAAETGVEAPRPAEPSLTGTTDVRHGASADWLSRCADSGSLEYFDARTRWGAFWVGSAEHLLPWQRTSPLRELLGAVAFAAGGCLVHAAAVGSGERGVLLVGPEGSGKSITAVTCAALGFSYVGDEFVVLRREGQELMAHSLYSTAKLDHTAFAREPSLLDAHDRAAEYHDGTRRVIYLGELGCAVSRSLAIDAVVLVELAADGMTRLTSVTHAELLRDLLSTSGLLLGRAGQLALDGLPVWLPRVAGFRLKLGADLQDAAVALASLVKPACTTPRAAREKSRDVFGGAGAERGCGARVRSAGAEGKGAEET